jgi:hypothetical protein
VKPEPPEAAPIQPVIIEPGPDASGIQTSSRSVDPTKTC